MVVEDVWAPKPKSIIDPKTTKEKEDSDDSEYWEKKQRTARARREYEEEEARTKKLKEDEGKTPEPPFQVKGSVNLGTFDLQAEQEKLRATIAQIQEESRIKQEALEKTAASYKDELYKIQIKMVEDTTRAQIESMQKSLEQNLTKSQQRSITDQIAEIGQIANVLGYRKPEAEAGLPAEIRLQMLKIDIDEKQTQRKFEWDKMVAERNWQLELKKLDQENVARMAKIQEEKEKRNIWATPFESLGMAIAKGLLDSGNGGKVTRGGPVKRSAHKLQAEDGESGEVECPECREPIAIAPTAKSATCPSCETRISINRTPREQDQNGQL